MVTVPTRKNHTDFCGSWWGAPTLKLATIFSGAWANGDGTRHHILKTCACWKIPTVCVFYFCFFFFSEEKVITLSLSGPNLNQKKPEKDFSEILRQMIQLPSVRLQLPTSWLQGTVDKNTAAFTRLQGLFLEAYLFWMKTFRPGEFGIRRQRSQNPTLWTKNLDLRKKTSVNHFLTTSQKDFVEKPHRPFSEFRCRPWTVQQQFTASNSDCKHVSET